MSGQATCGHLCLVTGHTGFIGSALMRELSRLGHKPVGLEEADGTGVDLREHSAVERTVARLRPDILFHMGGVSGPMCHANDPVTVLRVNVEGTQVLLDAARDHGVRRVITAASVAGYARQGPLGPEPDSVYGLTKRVVELQTRLWARQTGREATTVRIGSVYGPGRQTESPIHRMIQDALTTGAVQYVPHVMEPCIEIRTCAGLLARLADVPVLRPRYDAVTERPTADEVAEIVVGLTGARLCPQPADQTAFADFPEDFDSVPLTVDTGHGAHVGLRETIADLVAAGQAAA